MRASSRGRLQVTLEVPGGLVARLRIGDRLRRVSAPGQPGTIRADVLTIGVLGSRCQRRPIQVPQAPRSESITTIRAASQHWLKRIDLDCASSDESAVAV